MIIINVLPPEYRRRDIGVNPITLSIAGAVAVNLIVLALWLFVMLISIPHAELVKSEKEAEKTVAAANAKKVDDAKKEITDKKNYKQALFDLLNKKVLWAETLDDFVQVITDKGNALNKGKFRVSVGELRIEEVSQELGRTRANKNKTVTGRLFRFQWTVQFLVEDAMQMNAHVHTFFKEFEKNDKDDFWMKHSFRGMPDKNYGGNTTVIDEDLNKSHTEFDLAWERYVVSKNAERSVTTKKFKGNAGEGVK